MRSTMEYEIMYEDEALMLVYKPAGIAVETSRLGQQDMVSLLRNYRALQKQDTYIGLVHRLDQPVEGLMVFGKTKEATANLSAQVANRSFGKHYLAIGKKPKTDSAQSVLQKKGTLEGWIFFDRQKNVSRLVKKGTPQAKAACLDYEVMGETKDYVCFAITLHTGRHHQIRVQFAEAGYPLVGDQKYGTEEKKQQLALCAYKLGFVHPTTKKEMEFCIHPYNELFQKICNFVSPCQGS